MGHITVFEPWKLIIGLLIRGVGEESPPDGLVNALSERFGAVDFISESLPFTYTDYYREEMGEAIIRKFISFKPLLDPSNLAAIKRQTNDIEELFAAEGKRRVNIDPGLLNLSRLILASTKDNAHRIPLSEGIFGEITLLYKQKLFTSLPWTYPDYQTCAYHEIFLKIRNIFKAQLKQQER